MPVLHPESWKVFGEWSLGGFFIPDDVSEEILLILRSYQIQEIGGQIKDQYISGFKKENRGYVEGICREILEREETRIHCSDCHPGRLSLNPDEGVRAVGGNPSLLCGGYVMSSRKHRKLSPDVAGTPSPSDATHTGWKINEGFQDVYFLGGLPLIYWSFGGQMGMKLPDKDMANKTEWLSGIWMWRGKEDVARYQLTDGLLAFGECGFDHKDIDIWTYTKYIQRQEQNMLDDS